MVLFVSFVLIYSSEEFIMTPVAGFLDRRRYILFMSFVLVILLLVLVDS